MSLSPYPNAVEGRSRKHLGENRYRAYVLEPNTSYTVLYRVVVDSNTIDVTWIGDTG